MSDLDNRRGIDSLGTSNLAQTGQQSRAEYEFERAHRAAFVQGILAPLRNQPADLLPFEQVRERLRLSSQTYRGLQEVPLSQIVGSVARYHDFSRAFQPRHESLRERWQRVMELQGSLPPVELYKVGEVYFVVDGNHRVSVARQANASTIRAHVWEYQTRVPVESNDNLNDILIRQEYLEFLEQSHLDVSRPNQRIVFTVPGGYRRLGETIAQHREWLDRQHIYTVSFEEAAADWYDAVYMPMVCVIRDRKMLREFPGRTEADLVVYILRYRDELEQEWSGIAPAPAASLVDTDVTSTVSEEEEARLRSRQAAQEFVQKARQSGWRRLVAWFKRKILKWEILDRHPKQDPE
jgi:hypothetical protein